MPRRKEPRVLREVECPGCKATYRTHLRSLKYCVPFCGLLYRTMTLGRCFVCGAHEALPFFWFTPEMRADAQDAGASFADAHAACRRQVLDEDYGLERLQCRCVDCLAEPERAGQEKPAGLTKSRWTRTSGYQRHRDAVIARDGWTCQICFLAIDQDALPYDDRSLALDHVIQVANGGSDDVDNLRAAHRWCNIERENVFMHFGDEGVRDAALQRFGASAPDPVSPDRHHVGDDSVTLHEPDEDPLT